MLPRGSVCLAGKLAWRAGHESGLKQRRLANCRTRHRPGCGDGVGWGWRPCGSRSPPSLGGTGGAPRAGRGEEMCLFFPRISFLFPWQRLAGSVLPLFSLLSVPLHPRPLLHSLHSLPLFPPLLALRLPRQHFLPLLSLLPLHFPPLLLQLLLPRFHAISNHRARATPVDLGSLFAGGKRQKSSGHYAIAAVPAQAVLRERV